MTTEPTPAEVTVVELRTYRRMSDGRWLAASTSRTDAELAEAAAAAERATRREWAAAYRHAAAHVGGLGLGARIDRQRLYDSAAVGLNRVAARIESGDLRPWATEGAPS